MSALFDSPPFAHRWYEDFAVGQRFAYGRVAVTAAKIKEFAREYDPEPYHVDEAAAAASIFGGLIASGLQVAGWWRRACVDAFPNLRDEGSPGWDEVRWVRPTRPGETLSVITEVIEMRPLKSRPTIGFLRWKHALVAGPGEERMNFIGMLFVRRRPAVEPQRDEGGEGR
jgi:acyl dehydratase